VILAKSESRSTLFEPGARARSRSTGGNSIPDRLASTDVLPAGSHQVTFSYQPLSISAGVALALVAGLALVIVFRWPR
jgi:hypothetical protein